jgi:hypothetical protein
VHNLGEHVAVLAFALGVVFGLTFEPKMVRRGPKKTDVAPTAAAAAASPPPVAADPVVEEPAIEEPPGQQAESGEQKPAAPPA